jgi:hypothetical protein
VIIGKERPMSWEDKILSREVVLEKADDGKNILKITVKASRLGRGASWQLKARSELCSAENTEPTSMTGRADRPVRSYYGELAKDAQAKEPCSG